MTSAIALEKVFGFLARIALALEEVLGFAAEISDEDYLNGGTAASDEDAIQ